MAIIKHLTNMEKMNQILKLKASGVPEDEVIPIFQSQGYKPPALNTVHKYYNSNDEFTKEKMMYAYAKDKAFDEPHCKIIIMQCMNNIGESLKMSSLYDLLQERLVEHEEGETNILEKLPGNEQTLRNYCKYLISTGQVTYEAKKKRVYDLVETPAAGLQVQVDYGVQQLKDGTHFHFIALLLRHSRVLYIKGMDHKFDGEATCNALYTFFSLIGGKPKQLAIDQDSCMIYQETHGEIITTKVFKDFLEEQNLALFVCKKADPESKGPIENTVKFVKTNYLPSRLNLTVNEVIKGASAWCKRKNRRIHRTTLWIPNEKFEEVEAKELLPLAPSQYDLLHTQRIVTNVDKTHSVRYHTNSYVLPPEFAYGKVYKKITKTAILFYKTEDGNDFICSYELPLENVKQKIFRKKEYKVERGHEWEKIRESILRTYNCNNMLHYLNGLRKENQRYLYSQHLAFQKLLKERFSTLSELDEILGIACKFYRYQIGQLKEVWDTYWKDREISQKTEPKMHYDGIQGKLNLDYDDVQAREPSVYEEYFNKKAGL